MIRVRCIVCGIEEELGQEDQSDITKMVNKNPNAKTTDHLRYLNIMRGLKCKEGAISKQPKEHSFVFTDGYMTEVVGMTDTFVAIRNKESETNAKIEELESKKQRLETELESCSNELDILEENKTKILDDRYDLLEKFKGYNIGNIEKWV